MSLLLLVLLPFIGSAVAAVLPTNARNLESLWAALVVLAVGVPLAMLYPAIEAGQVLTERLGWLPTLGVDVIVRLDGFAWLFAMLVSGMGLLVIVYARYYMSPEDPAARFYSLLLGFMGAMLGVVVSGNLVQLVVFWELTSIFSFLLIGYWTHRKDARRGARMAFTVTASGGLALLAGALGHRDVVLDRGWRGPGHAAVVRFRGHVPERPQGPAGVFHAQPPRAHHLAAGHEQPAGRRGRGVPHAQPRHLQGLAVHVGGHHRPRDRHARHAAPGRPVPQHAHHRHVGHRGERGHGRGAAAQRLPLQGDVLRRDGLHQHPPLAGDGTARDGHAGRHLRGGLFAAPGARRVLRSPCAQPAAPASGAGALDARAGGAAGAGLRGGGHHAGLVGGAGAGHGGQAGGGRCAARVQPGALAWLQHPADDEPGGHGGRAGGLPAVRAALQGASRRWRAGFRLAQRQAPVRADPGVAVRPGSPPAAPAGHPPPAAADAGPGGRGAVRWCGLVVDRAAGLGRPRARAADAGVRRAVGHRGLLRGGRGLAGQVPPAGGTDHAGRGRAGAVHHLRLVLGARPGAHPAGRRGGDGGALPAGPALDAHAGGDGGPASEHAGLVAPRA